MLRHYLPRRATQSGRGRHRLTRRSTLTVRTLAARLAPALPITCTALLTQSDYLLEV